MNIAVCLARLGVAVELITAVGNDTFGEEIRHALKREHVGQRYLVTGGQAQRQVGSVVVEIREYRGRRSVKVQNESPLYDSFGTALVNALRVGQPKPDMIIVTFELPDTAMSPLVRSSASGVSLLDGEAPPLLVIQPAPGKKLTPVLRELLCRASVIVPNRSEAHMLLRRKGVDARGDAIALRSKYGARLACITLGESGSAWATKDESGMEKVTDVTNVDPIGASDVFTGALAASFLKNGDSAAEAVAFATVAAGLSVACASTQGAFDCAPTKAELHAFLAGRLGQQSRWAQGVLERLG